MNNSLFILTFDEDNTKNDNHIVTIFTGKMVKAGQYSETINHYNILRTIEDMYGLPFACNASAVTPISDCWNISNGVNEPEPDDNIILIYPNPASGEIIIRIGSSMFGKPANSIIYNETGKKILEENFTSSLLKKIQLINIPSGIYLVKVNVVEKTYTKKLIIQ